MVQNALPLTRLYFDENMVRGESHAIASGIAVMYSARCPDRETNEDAAALIPFTADSGILAVADGVGGNLAGHHAASLAIEALKTSLADGVQDTLMLRTAILNGVETANRTVQALGVGAATTLALVELRGNTIRPYHVGDSMILVVGQRGRIKVQTTPHSPVGFAVEAGFLDETEAMHHKDRHLVSNVIGSIDMKIEVGSTIRLAPRDTVLLASDGLFDNLAVEEIIERIRKGPIETIVERLATDATQRMIHPEDGQPSKPDDLTFSVFRLSASVSR